MESNKPLSKKLLFFIIAISVVIVFFLLIVNSSQNNIPGQTNNIQSKRRILFHDLYERGGLLIYPSVSYAKEYLTSAENIKKEFIWAGLKVVPDTSVTNQMMHDYSIIVIGTPGSNKVLNKLVGLVPVNFSNKRFSYHNITYTDSSTVLNLIYFNPFNKSKLLYFISGLSDSYISHHISFQSAGDVRIIINNQCAVMDFFKIDNTGNWVNDENSYRNFESEKKEYKISDNFHYTVYSEHPENIMVNKLNTFNEASLLKIKQFFGKEFKIHKTKFYIYDNFEDKGLITGSTQISMVNWKDSSIHVVSNDWIDGNDFSKTALLLLRRNFGEPKIHFLEEGLSVYFSENWRGKGYKFWAAMIASSENIPGLKDLLNNNILNYQSYLITEPLAAVFVSYLIDKMGVEKFLNEYSNWTPRDYEITEYETGWKNFLMKYAADFKEDIETYKKTFPKGMDSHNNNIPQFQKGFCFAHEGYDIYNGYISRLAYASVEKMKSLGANSYSITPFTSMRTADKPEPLRFWEFAGAENDECLIYQTHVSKKLNMCLMLKPQIYLGQSSWPGNIKMTNENDWKLFFNYYFNWIYHYAMLAEIYKIPILCIGNEFSKATIGHAEEWIQLIKKIRKIYGGKIVYGANWDSEFENISFWNQLDYIGLSEYFPLSKKDHPTADELLNGAMAAIKKIENIQKKYNKLVIFTEVGFRSSDAPWKTALEDETKSRLVSLGEDLQDQARCYEALFEASYNKKWLTGMYWWKWPSFLSFDVGAYDESYTPNNKPAYRTGRPAEQVVKDWYTKKWN